MPIPIEYIDVLRVTETDLDDTAESTINGFWYKPNDDTENMPGPARGLSNAWVGKTLFQILRPQPPEGYMWQEGRLTRQQHTTRPDNIWVEIWRAMSKGAKAEAIT